MREPMVGSLISVTTKFQKELSLSYPLEAADRLALLFIALCGLYYKFCNYRQEGAVTQFLNDVFSGHPDTAIPDGMSKAEATR
jgi:hypothetical protein